MKKRILIVGLLCLIAVAIFGAFLYENMYLPAQQQQQAAMYAQQLQLAQGDFYSGNFTQSIDSVTAQLAGHLTNGQEGMLKLLLAADLWSRGQNDDVEKSIQTYAAFAADPSFPLIQRVAAMNSLAMEVSLEGISPTQYQAYLSTAPFSEYLPKTGSDYVRMQEAYMHILAASDQLYPNSFAEYAIADNYYVPLLTGAEATTTTQKDLATTIQKYISQGDSKSDSALYGSDSSLPVWGNIYRSLALNQSAKVLGNKTLVQREAGFQLALQTAQAHAQQTHVTPSALVLFSSFYYAAFLRNEAYPAEKSKILALLEPFAGIDTSKVNVSYFANLKDRPDSNPVKAVALKLAAVSPTFKTFLISVGFSNL